MSRLWLIAAATFRQRLRSGTFVMLTVAVPLLMVAAGVASVLLAEDGGELPRAVGVVDRTGALVPPDPTTIGGSQLEGEGNLLVTPQDSLEAAQAALRDGEIGSYLVVPEGYLDGEAVTYHAPEEPSAAVEEGLRFYLRRALLGPQPDWVYDRLQDPAAYAYVGEATGQEVREGPGLLLRVLAPTALGVAFALAVFTGASLMGSAIIRDKEQRAMEILVTSVRPRDVVAGKVLGLALLSLAQLGLWGVAGLLVAALALRGDLWANALAIPWTSLVWGAALFVPAYFVFALISAGLGIIAGDERQAQQLTSVVGLFGLLPFWIIGPVIVSPQGAIAVGLTLFPLTAPVVALVRLTFAGVPTWQLLASLAILLLTLAVAMWLVTKVFRAAMLSYGQTLSPRQVWRALTQA